MEYMFVKMAKDFGKEFKANEVYKLDDETAKTYINAGIATEVADPSTDYIAQFGKSLEERDSKLVARLSESLKAHNPKVPALAKSQDETSVSEFVSLVGKTASNNHNIKETAYNTLANKYGRKAMTQGGNTAGGFLVPEQWANELLAVDGYDGAMFPGRVRLFPMETDVAYFPVLDQTVTPSGGSSAFYAGVTVAVIAEGSAPGAETKPAFKQLTLTAKKLLAFTDVASELIDNSPTSVEMIVRDNFQKAIGSWVDYNVFNGAGGSDHLTGIINHAATISVPRETADTIKLSDLANMYCRLTPGSRNRAFWAVNPLGLGKLPLIGTSSVLAWLPNGASGALAMSIFGLPIVVSEALPTLGDDGDIMLIDPAYYMVGLNKDITIDASRDFKFTSDLVTYRVAARLDGKPVITAPVKLMNGTDTVSPFIQLDATVAS